MRLHARPAGAGRPGTRGAAGRGEQGGSKLRGWLRFAGAATRTFRRYLPHRLRLHIGTRTEVLRVPSLTIAANALDPAAERMFARARLDGGELAVYVIDRLRLADLLRLSVGFLRHDWRRDPVMHERRAGSLTIASRRPVIRVMNDGELMELHSPLDYRIRPLALRVMAPAPEEAAAP